MKKEKITLQFALFYHLKNELDIILKYDLDGISRLWFSLLNKLILEEYASIESLKESLILKYGTVSDEQNYLISEKLEDGQINPNYISFINEFNQILGQTKEIEYYPLKPEYFTLITNKEIQFVYNFIKISE
jgi:hypothetical protein